VGRYIWRPLIEVVSIFFSAFYSVLSQNFPKTVLPASAFFNGNNGVKGSWGGEKETRHIFQAALVPRARLELVTP